MFAAAAEFDVGAKRYALRPARVTIVAHEPSPCVPSRVANLTAINGRCEEADRRLRHNGLALSHAALLDR